MSYLTVPLNSSYYREDFHCGRTVLDNYLKKQASQDMKRRLSVCFILPDADNRVKGYYTLSNAGISREIIPTEISKKLPESYISLPVTLLGRLAVDTKYKGTGLGKMLLLDALKRSFDVSTENIGSFAVIVDPLDSEAVSFYEKYGFITLPDSERMFLPMKTVAALFEQM